MIALGTDVVDIERFKNWPHYTSKMLERIFSPEEIAYCRACPKKSAERFAVRFALKEAFYKALCTAYPDLTFSSLVVARSAQVLHAPDSLPKIIVDWDRLGRSPLLIHASLSHAQKIAHATVVLE